MHPIPESQYEIDDGGRVRLPGGNALAVNKAGRVCVTLDGKRQQVPLLDLYRRAGMTGGAATTESEALARLRKTVTMHELTISVLREDLQAAEKKAALLESELLMLRRQRAARGGAA